MDEIEILEIYVPARLEYLSDLYVWLREQLYNHPKPLLRGFSIYEVNGGFRDDAEVFEERTVVIRIVLDTPHSTDNAKRPEGGASSDREEDERPSRDAVTYDARVAEIAQAFRKITKGREKELWLIRIPGRRILA